MKEPVFYYFGIYKLEAWTRQWTVMIKSKADGADDDCIVLPDGTAWDAKQIYIANCVDAISLLDAREMWIIHNNLQIMSVVSGGKCIEVHGRSEGNYVQV